MELLVRNLSEVFAVSIIHSLWQCLLIYMLLRIALADAIRLSAAAKHNATVAGLLFATVWFIYTLFDQAANYSWHISTNTPMTFSQHLPLITTIEHWAKQDDRYELVIQQYLPYISIIYALGLLFHSVKFTFAWLQIRELKRTGSNDGFWQQKADALRRMLNIKKLALISITDKIDVPCITGYLKPVILIPISLTANLSVKEVEAILLHELAHVKRNDYLVNLLQQVVSVILFFNPFILLMNRIINHERENACDDVVVNVSGSPLVYAQALLKVEQLSHQQLQLALAASGTNKFHLLNRIERIMKTKTPMANVRHIAMALTILAITVLGVTWFNPAIGNGKITIRKIQPPIGHLFTDTVKTKSKKAKKKSVPKGDITLRRDTAKHVHHYWDNGWDMTGFDDPQLQKLSAEVNKHGDAVSKYFESADFKETERRMNELGEQMNKYYNSDEFKKMQEDLNRKGEELNKRFDDPEYKRLQDQLNKKSQELDELYKDPNIQRLQNESAKLGKDMELAYGDKNGEMAELGKKMGEAGKKMETYYNSDEFKKLNERLEKKYGIPHERQYFDDKNDENYRKYQAELRANTPADVIAASEEMKRMGEKMRSHYDSPDMKEKSARMRAWGDSMRQFYNNPKLKEVQQEVKELSRKVRDYTRGPEMRQLQDDMKSAGAKMRDYTNDPKLKAIKDQLHAESAKLRSFTHSPEIDREKEELHKASAKLRAYTSTPEFKKKVEDWKKAHPEARYDWVNENHNDSHNDNVNSSDSTSKSSKP